MNTEFTTEECLEAYYDSLEKQVRIKDAMIDWLAVKLEKSGFRNRCADCWVKFALEAVKKND